MQEFASTSASGASGASVKARLDAPATLEKLLSWSEERAGSAGIAMDGSVVGRLVMASSNIYLYNFMYLYNSIY